MVNFPYIDIPKSIKSEWLVFKNKWFRLPDIAQFISFPILALIVIFFIYAKNFNIANQNDRAFGFFVLPLVIIGCLYVIYRKITETKLSKISTSLSPERNKELLKNFITQQGLNIFHESGELVVGGAEESLSINYNRMQVYIFILSEKKILFTMLKVYSRGNPPVFIDHLFLKRDLKRFFSDKYQ